jgi:uncharacterized protein (TIGR02145 family)
MKTNTTIFRSALAVVLLVLATTQSYAISYTISFTASGASSSVGSVEVKNLTQATTVTVPDGNTLTLTDLATAVNAFSANDGGIRISRIASTGKSILTFYAAQAGNAQMAAFALDGRKVVGLSTHLEAGDNSLELALPSGMYAIRILGAGYAYSVKLQSQTRTATQAGIKFLSHTNVEGSAPKKSKATPITTTTMTYAIGDQMLYTATSGNYGTVVTDIPNGDKTTNFNFVACQDADLNNYKTVNIGNQIWMVENLKTTHFRNGDTIPGPTGDWSALTCAQAAYNDDAANATKYGLLYNWYAVVDSRGIAPTGWHVPTDAEWTTLTTYLGGVNAGGKLKETGTGNWSSPNTGATNETGFSALPGGGRNSDGTFGNVGDFGFWWSSSEGDQGNGWGCSRVLYCNGSYVIRSNGVNQDEFSVRCIKDDAVTVSLPTLTTTAITVISSTTASSGGYISSDGGALVKERGVCWSTSPAPTIALTTKSSDGTGMGTFSSTISGLTPNTTYYVRAFATNSVGTAYGNEVSFTTSLFTIGDLYLGGKIAYLDASGIHGFVCALSDQSTGSKWYNISSITTGATNTELETSGVYGVSKSGGRKNTDAIIQAQGAGTYAASICASLTIGGATAGDWYLPSQGELNQMYINKTILGGFATSPNAYWSSNENYMSNAFFQSLDNGYQGISDKGALWYVRAIRAF